MNDRTIIDEVFAVFEDSNSMAKNFRTLLSLSPIIQTTLCPYS
ncbi:hypothetical protein IC575_012386 [Cucumis melo]